MTNLPNPITLMTNRIWTKELLKSILRFFQLHGERGKHVQLTGNRSELIGRVESLLAVYNS